MNSSDKNTHDRNEATKAFDPPLIHEEEIERSVTGDEEAGIGQEEQSTGVEEDKEARKKTELATKEAILKVPSGQL
jgi:hypothetical protein